MMDFDEKLERLNENPKANYHIFAEYTGGKHDYFTSRETLESAKRCADRLHYAVIYDRTGKDVYFHQ